MSYIPGLSPFAADRARPYLPVSRQLGSLCWLSASFSFLFFSLPPPHPPLSHSSALKRNCHRAISKSQKSVLSKNTKTRRKTGGVLSLGEFPRNRSRGLKRCTATFCRCTSFNSRLPPSWRGALARPPKLFRVFTRVKRGPVCDATQFNSSRSQFEE